MTMDQDAAFDKRLAEPTEENGVTRWYFRKQTEFYKVSYPLYRWLRRETHRFDVVHVHGLFSFASVVAPWRRAGPACPTSFARWATSIRTA